jgi:endoglycosylceramidase
LLAGELVLCFLAMGCALPPERTLRETTVTMPLSIASETPARPTRDLALQISGRHFVDAHGRAIILRGVNLAGDSKVPPFSPCATPDDLDRLADVGFNVIRLLFVWEAYEPSPGVYNDLYAKDLSAIAAAAHTRGIWTIIDFHQDGFSRFASRGAGDGFPQWAVSPRGWPSKPDNGPACKNWQLWVAMDPTTHWSFADFFSDRHGVRTRYLAMLGRAAGALAETPGVIGYDLLNEPWGDERAELAPLYRDAAEVIHAAHPSALLFLEGHVTTSFGIQTRLPRPNFGRVAYAPHYYRPLTITLGRWHGTTLGMNRAFTNMIETAQIWGAPLFLGEFGVGADAHRAGDYVDAIYDRLDAVLASGAQWNYTPRWNARTKDGWNAEDYNILEPSGAFRPNFHPRPYPRATAGTPLRFRFEDRGPACQPRWFELVWNHEPDRGETEIFVPTTLFPAVSQVELSGSGATCERDLSRQLVVCRARAAMTIHLKVTAPADAARLVAGERQFGSMLEVRRGAG